MTREMQKAIEKAFGPTKSEFLERFKAMGWYLDDLVLTLVNQLGQDTERQAKCLAAQNSLSARIEEYQPKAIVALL